MPMRQMITFEGRIECPSDAILLQLEAALRQCNINPEDFVWKTTPPRGALRFQIAIDATDGAAGRVRSIVEHMQQVSGVQDVRWRVNAEPA
jgi:hypothetical protein